MSAADGRHETSYRITVKGGGIAIDMEVYQDTTRVVDIVMGGGAGSAAGASRRSTPSRRKRRAVSTKTDSDRSGAQRRRAASPGIVKELSLRPSGKQAFVDFAAE